MNILALNAGSSSLKFAVFSGERDAVRRLMHGAVRAIGTPRSRLQIAAEDGSQPDDQPVTAPDHTSALRHVFASVEANGRADPEAIGHRVVHGGATYAEPTLVNDGVLDKLRQFIPLAPLHQPQQIAVIEAVAEQFPEVRQVACFDTAIHRTLPEVAQRLPLPGWLWDEGVRRYGFHGLSYEFVLDSDAQLQQGRTIIAHLGHGASITAFREGVSVETTMGFTPTGGLIMATRSGDLDPGVLIHVMKHHGLTPDDANRLVTEESGLKGISDQTGDMKTLLERTPTDPRAALAVEMFCYRARTQIGALSAVLGGLDDLVFTGGIGERAAHVRGAVCRPLGFLGVTIDPSQNEAHAPLIHAAEGRCRVQVIPTDEEQMIARHTARLALP